MRRPTRRAILILLSIVIVGAAVGADLKLKTPAGLPYAPDDAEWTAFTSDFPSFWRSLTATDAFIQIREEWNPLHDVELAVRKATGIRPTPGRWRLWLGSPLLAAHRGSEYGFCVRPGLFLRGAHFINVLSGADSKSGIHRFGGLHYAWRSNWLIASPSRDFVEASLRSRGTPVDWKAPVNRIAMHWNNLQTSLAVDATPGLPVMGEIPLALPRSSGASRALPVLKDPLLVATARKGSSLALLNNWVLGTVQKSPAAPLAERLVPRAPVPPAALANADAAAYGVMGVNTDMWPPLLEAVIVTDDGYTSAPLGGLPSREGNGSRIASDVPDRLESALDAEAEGGPVESDIVLEIDWRRIALAAERIIRDGTERAQLALSTEDAEAYVLPPLRALGRLGRLRISGQTTPDGNTLSFEGNLAEIDKNRGDRP